MSTYSKDGKTYLSCGFGIPAPTCPCNGCRWEYGDPEMEKYPSLIEAIKDRSTSPDWEYGCSCGAWRSKDCNCGNTPDPRR